MRWPGYKHVFFDCDSTLTTVEGIDVLANSTGQTQSVESLTRAAMDGQLDLKDVYGRRLQVLNPTRQQIREIRQVYKRHVVEDAAAVIAALQALGHKVYIISGGLAEPVTEFGVYLGVPRRQIRAVDIAYDQLAGVWWEGKADTSAVHERYQAYETGGLTASDGKGEIVSQLLGDQAGRSMLVGDGHSDLLAGRAVDLFVGFGGVVRRERVMTKAPVFIHSQSLAPVLALAAGPAGLRQLQDTPYRALAHTSAELIEGEGITFQDERLKAKFYRAVEATFNPPH
jgi:phosphoserine phosphatase